MQIAWAAPTRSISQFGNLNVVTAAGLANRVHWLMNIRDEMHQELQRFHARRLAGMPVGQYLFEDRNPVHHAIMVNFNAAAMCLRPVAVARFGKSGGIPGNIHKVPTECFRGRSFLISSAHVEIDARSSEPSSSVTCRLTAALK